MPSLLDDAPALPRLDEQTVDDLLYSARVGDLPSLKFDLSAVEEATSASVSSILVSAIDNMTGNSCAHYAAANGHLDILQHIKSVVDVPASLLALLSKQNLAGNTPLHYASLNGHLSTVKFLIESTPSEARGELVGCQNQSGHDAAFEAEGNSKEDVVAFLLGVLDNTDDNSGEGIPGGGDRDNELSGEIDNDETADAVPGSAGGDSASKKEIDQIGEDLQRTRVEESPDSGNS